MASVVRFCRPFLLSVSVVAAVAVGRVHGGPAARVVAAAAAGGSGGAMLAARAPQQLSPRGALRDIPETTPRPTCADPAAQPPARAHSQPESKPRIASYQSARRVF